MASQRTAFLGACAAGAVVAAALFWWWRNSGTSSYADAAFAITEKNLAALQARLEKSKQRAIKYAAASSPAKSSSNAASSSTTTSSSASTSSSSTDEGSNPTRGQARVGLGQPAARGLAAAAAKPVSGLTGKGASGYYHFSSDGRKLPSKWDAFDVDAELARLDGEAEAGGQGGGGGGASAAGAAPAAARRSTPSTAPASAAPPAPSAPRVTRSQILAEFGGVAHDVEVCMADLDAVPCPSPAVRARRKELIGRLAALLEEVDREKAKV